MTAQQRDMERQKNNERKKRVKETMSEETKTALREKDRLRKKEKRLELKKKQSIEAIRRQKESRERIEWSLDEEQRKYWDDRFKQHGTYREKEPEFNRIYKRRVRGNRTEAEVEYDKIESLLLKRAKRQKRNGKEHLLDNLKAKQGMRDLREIGPIKGREFMRRVTRVKDEDDIWYSYWIKGSDYEELLLKRRPDTAAKMHERYTEYVEKITAHRKKEMERLQKWKEKDKESDAKGRWVYDDSVDEGVVWSIPDEKGNRKRCDEPQDDDKGWGENVVIDYSDYNMPDAGTVAYFKEMIEIDREEINRRQRERRQKLREELSKPMSGPEQGEKGDYEVARDDLVKERHRVMEESGLFNQKELQSMLNVII